MRVPLLRQVTMRRALLGVVALGLALRGLAFLERELPRRYGETFVVSGRFTFLGASK